MTRTQSTTRRMRAGRCGRGWPGQGLERAPYSNTAGLTIGRSGHGPMGWSFSSQSGAPGSPIHSFIHKTEQGRSPSRPEPRGILKSARPVGSRLGFGCTEVGGGCRVPAHSLPAARASGVGLHPEQGTPDARPGARPPARGRCPRAGRGHVRSGAWRPPPPPPPAPTHGSRPRRCCPSNRCPRHTSTPRGCSARSDTGTGPLRTP